MDRSTNPTVKKMMDTFLQMRRDNLHQHTVSGCKPSEIRVLFCIKKNCKQDGSEIKVSEISRRLQVTSPAVTQLLKGLEVNELIERHIDPVDRRAVGVTLTEKGEKVLQKVEEAFSEMLYGLMEFLGEEESQQLVELLSKSFRYLQEREARMHQTLWNGDEEV